MSRISSISFLLAVLPVMANCQDAPAPTGPDEPRPLASKFAITGFELTSVTGGIAHSCGLARDGQAYCWGSNQFGQLGDGTNDTDTIPSAVSGGLQFTSIDAGTFHTCAVTRGGQAFCWGDNSLGHLGDGSTNATSNVPVPVTGGLQFASVSAGSVHTCGVTSNGLAFCWGANNVGQLGGGTTNLTSNVPVPVSGGLEFVLVSAGSSHSCGLTKGGQVACWGNNFAGQLGNGTNTSTPQPTAVASAVQFVLVDAGLGVTCGIAKGGQALCWGSNFDGSLGNGNNTDSNVPVPVSGSYEFVSLTVGGNKPSGGPHVCGVRRNGQAYCWGLNDHGQFGDGTTTSSNVPVPVSGGFEFLSLSAGSEHTCGTTRQLGAWCWGVNARGQLGNGTFVGSLGPSPVKIP